MLGGFKDKYNKYIRKYENIKKSKEGVCKRHIPYDKFEKVNLLNNNKNIVKLIDDMKSTIHDVYVMTEDIQHKLQYINKPTVFRTNLHNGQRKLFMNELQFLTAQLESKDHEAYVIYAGAAPCNHIYLLHQLFPNVKFILVDPNPFNIYIKSQHITHLNTLNNKIVYLKYNDKNKKFYANYNKMNFYHEKSNSVSNKIVTDMPVNTNITNFIKQSEYRLFIINDLYTNELSKLFTNLDKKVYFWSDIRTALGNVFDDEDEKNKGSPTDLDIIWNLSQQFNWIMITKPSAYMVKFRCPYYIDHSKLEKKKIIDYIDKNLDKSFDISKDFGIDFVNNYLNKELYYLKGNAYIQPWGPSDTTEIRYVGDDLTQFQKYDCESAEERFFYYNTIDRTMIRHQNNFTNKEIGFDHCNDCSLEARIWNDYKNKIDSDIDVVNMVKRLIDLLDRPLKQQGHGFLFGEISQEKYKEIYNNYCS